MNTKCAFGIALGICASSALSACGGSDGRAVGESADPMTTSVESNTFLFVSDVIDIYRDAARAKDRLCMVAADQKGAQETAKLIGRLGSPVAIGLTEANNCTGTKEEYDDIFANVWKGVDSSLIKPAPGNHDYDKNKSVPHGFIDYFELDPGSTYKGHPTYTDHRIGRSWLVLALDSNLENEAMDEEVDWLDKELEKNRHSAIDHRSCVLAYFHHPVSSSGTGNRGSKQRDMGLRLWKVLADHHADLVLSGHEHNYERFNPLNRDRMVQDDGIIQVVVGTGGAKRDGYTTPLATGSAWVEGDAFGVLQLQLTDATNKAPGRFDGEFITTEDRVADTVGRGCLDKHPEP